MSDYTQHNHEKLLFLYAAALENNDFDTIQHILELAESDAVLDQLLLDLDSVLLAEEQPSMLHPTNNGHLSIKENQMKAQVLNVPEIKPVVLLPSRFTSRRWSLPITLAAAMVGIIIFGGIVFSALGTSPSSRTAFLTSTPSQSSIDTQLVIDYIETIWNNSDTAGIAEFITDDHVLTMGSYEVGAHDEYETLIGSIRQIFPTLNLEILEIAVDGEQFDVALNISLTLDENVLSGLSVESVDLAFAGGMHGTLVDHQIAATTVTVDQDSLVAAIDANPELAAVNPTMLDTLRISDTIDPFVLFNLMFVGIEQNFDEPSPMELAQFRVDDAAQFNAIVLDLTDLGLETLPPEIWGITSLQRIYLDGNHLSELPPEIGNLVNLEVLDMPNNQLTELPPEIGRLTKMREMYLGNNQLTELPPEIGNLVNLEKLALWDNQLTTLPPDIGQLTQLLELYLWNNNLSSLPPEIGDLESVWMLAMQNNALTELPPEIGNLSNIEWLEVGNNQLTALPAEIGNLDTLDVFKASENDFESLPLELWMLPDLFNLDLSNIGLTELPIEVAQLTKLETLILDDNQLTSLPEEITQLGELNRLSLSGNQFAEVPSEILAFENLFWLFLQNNQLTSLPSDFSQLTNLCELDLSNNQLAEYPEVLDQMTLINTSDDCYANLDGNPFMPADDTALAYQEAVARIEEAERTNATVLDLSGLGLETVPPEIGNLTNLKVLHLYDNQLTELPAEIGNLSNLEGITGYNNRIAVLPPEIGNLNNLKALDLRQNQLTNLPPEIGQLSALELFLADNNQLSRLPSEIGNLSNIEWLAVGNNQLTTLPAEIGQLTALEILKADNNQLSNIPHELWSLTNLRDLSLHGNQLTELPSEIGQLVQLENLSISSNFLTSLPPEIGQVSALEQFSVDNNQLTNLPSEIGNLSNLDTLDFRRNQLTSLPPDIGQLTTLESLMLSSNQLSVVPLELWSLTNLLYLEMHGNQLTELPSAIGQLTHLERLFMDSNLLTSLPPEIGQLTNLCTLTLRSNQLDAYPEVLDQLVRLNTDSSCSFDLDDNPFMLTNNADTAYQEAVARIEEAERTNATVLDLSGLGLETVPPDIGNLTNLQILYLYDNQLSELPAEIGNLSNLEVILAHNNQIAALPQEIANLSNLLNLMLSTNQLTELPPEIGQLANLERFSVKFNQLTSLPSEIVELTHLCEFDISVNQFEQYPALLDQMTHINDEWCIFTVFGNPYNMPESADSAGVTGSGAEAVDPVINSFSITYPSGNQYNKTIAVQWDTLAWGVHLDTVKAEDGQTGPAIPDYAHVLLPLMEGEAIFEMSQLFPSAGGYFLRLVASNPDGTSVSQVVPVFIEPTETIRPSFNATSTALPTLTPLPAPTEAPSIAADTALPATSHFGSQFSSGNRLDDVISLNWSVRGDGAYLQVVDAADGSGGSPIAGYERLALPLPSGEIQLPIHQLVPSDGEYVLRLVGTFQNEIVATLSNQIEVVEGSESTTPAATVTTPEINQFEVSFPNDNRFDQTITIQWDTLAENVHLEVVGENPAFADGPAIDGYDFIALPTMSGQTTLNVNQLFPSIGTYYLRLIASTGDSASTGDGALTGSFATVEIQSSSDTTSFIPSSTPIIQYFYPVEDVIRYDGYVQAPNTSIVIRWHLFAVDGMSYVFEQIMSDGEAVEVSASQSIDGQQLPSHETSLSVCVGAAGCEYDGGITLRLSVYDAEGVILDTATITVGVEHYSMSNPQ